MKEYLFRISFLLFFFFWTQIYFWPPLLVSSPRSGGIEKKQRNSKSTMITLRLHFSQLLSSWTHFSKKGGGNTNAGENFYKQAI